MRSLRFFRNGFRESGRGGQNHLPFYLGRNFSRFSPQVEEYRGLRTAVELMSQGRDAKTILITSPGPGEGKSTIVVNLGLLFWEFGRNVLLIDCDLRMPSLHKAFGLRNVRGITDLLAGNADASSVQSHVAEGFVVLPRGAAAPNPPVLFRSLAFREALAFYREQADVILVDSSPLLAVSDAIQIVPAADVVLLVVQAGRTKRRDIVRAKKLLAAARANLLGTVLNKVEPAEGHYYYREPRYRHYFEDGQVTRDTAIRRIGPGPAGPGFGS
jgi:capsular exopolysaccharide synthesis family protein